MSIRWGAHAATILTALALAVVAACGGAPSTLGGTPHDASPKAVAPVTLEVRDLSPKFLTFFARASADGVTPDRRFELWHELYGFAAVPPGPDGDAMARTLLDHAWAKYPSVIDRIRSAPPIMVREAQTSVDRVAALLQLDRPLRVKLLLYVGALETNAFTFMLDDGIPNVALPVEGPPEMRPNMATHELTHAVHLPLAHLPGGWERSIAQTVVTEGLAMRVTQALHPGGGDESYTEATPGWLRAASANQRAILVGIRASLAARDGATVRKFTFGAGTTVIEREAYFVGWVVVGHLLLHGTRYEAIARVHEA
jgi:hypothetical protein